MEAFIAEEVVSLGPVAASRADKAVVTVNINYAIAKRTEMLCFKNRHAKPSLHHGFEVQRVDVPMQGLGRDSMEPLSGAASGGKVKVGLASRVGLARLKQRLTGVLVQTLRKSLLSWRLTVRNAVDASGHFDIRIEVLPRCEQGRRVGIPSVVGVELGAEFMTCGAGSQVSGGAVMADGAEAKAAELGRESC